MGWPYQQKPPMGWPLDYDSGLADFVGAWFFLEGSGNKVFDLSGNGITGTEQQDSVWKAGKYGTSRYFSGDDYISLGQGPNNRLNGASAMTMLIWFKADAVPAADFEYMLYADVDGDKTGWGVGFSSNQLFANGRSVTGDNLQNVLVGFTDTTSWHCAVGVNNFAGDRQQLCLDGILVGDEAATFGNATYTLGTPNRVCAIGARPADKLINGQISHVMIFNRALSASEIALLYQYPFWMFKDPAEIALLGGYQVVVGNAGIMTTNTGYWGPTY